MLYIPVTNVAGFGVVTEAPAHTHSHKHRNAEHILTAPNALCLFLKSVSYLARTYARSIFFSAFRVHSGHAENAAYLKMEL